MLIALFIVNVYLQIEGARKHSSAISAPVIFFDVGTELCMLDNGRITKMLQIYDSSKQLREIVGYSEKPDLLMLLCDTDAGKKYFSLQDGRLMPVLYNPSDHKEVFRHGFFFYSKLDDDGVLWVFKYELGGKPAGMTRLQLPHYKIAGYGNIDVSKSGSIAITITDSRDSDDYIFLFNNEGKFLCRAGKGYTPSFSPDGKSVAYCTGKLGVVEVYHIPSGRLTRHKVWAPSSLLDYGEPFFMAPWRPYRNYGTGWSKDGKWLFCGMVYCHTGLGLHAVNLDSGDWSVVSRSIYSSRSWIAGTGGFKD
jgi:hypothetical protein